MLRRDELVQRHRERNEKIHDWEVCATRIQKIAFK